MDITPVRWLTALLGLMVLSGLHCVGQAAVSKSAPTFYKDVLPIIQQHCQICHRPGEIAPTSFVSYEETHRWADSIRHAVQSRKMPPWFADPCCGQFANDPSLTLEQISTIVAWADGNAPAGNPEDAPPVRHLARGWNIEQPDLVIPMPRPVPIPQKGDVEYTYEIVPTNFAQDRWVQMSELRPSRRDHVHHAVVYVRPPGADWLREAPVGVPFTASTLHDPKLQHEAHATTSDVLLVYAPGSSPDQWPDGMAKFIPAHADLVFQMHYTTNGHVANDQTALGLVFAKTPPRQRVLTLQLNGGGDFPIPAETDDYRVEVRGTLPNDATLLSFFPHMHLRGKRFEYDVVHADKSVEPLLKVNYDFYWQLSYKLAQPRFLPAGTELRAIATYDNSRKNPHNPDPDSPVQWGDQTYNEMMVGFFDVAVPAGMDKFQYFVRPPHAH